LPETHLVNPSGLSALGHSHRVSPGTGRPARDLRSQFTSASAARILSQ
jgi:hypothetical protein